MAADEGACESEPKEAFATSPHSTAKIDRPSFRDLQHYITLHLTFTLPTQHHLPNHKHFNLAFFTEDTLYAGFEKVIMSEVTFAKTFLATLDKRPIKLPADHVSDPRKLPGQSPVSPPPTAQSSIP